MGIENLKIIGETINESVPHTRRLFEENDLRGIVELATFQEKKGAEYIDVNIGQKDPNFIANLIRILQGHVSTPLSIDSPDIEIVRAGLEAYDPSKAKGKIPIVNSISENRIEVFELTKIQPFKVILIAFERKEDRKAEKNLTGEDILQTAKRLAEKARNASYRMANNDLIIDPGIAPIGADMEGVTRMALQGIRLIKNDPEMRGVHFSVGLSNFSAMLPSKRSDGTLVKTAMENAFLTLAVPIGLDYIIGNVAKDYSLLEMDHPAYRALAEAIELGGIESIMRIRQFYQMDEE